MRLVLIRHGATEWSVSGRNAGHTDVALSATGRTQLIPLARVLRDNLSDTRDDRWDEVAIYSSPLDRTLESIRLVMGKGRGFTADSRLAEFDYVQ